MEKHPVREKTVTKLGILRGSHAYSLVHSEVKTRLGNRFKKEKSSPSHWESTLPFGCLSSWVAREILSVFLMVFVSTIQPVLSLSSAATRNCTAVQKMISKAQFSVRKDIYRLKCVCRFPSTVTHTQCGKCIHDIQTTYAIHTQK